MLKQKLYILQLPNKELRLHQPLKPVRSPLTKLGNIKFDLLSFPEGISYLPQVF